MKTVVAIVAANVVMMVTMVVTVVVVGNAEIVATSWSVIMIAMMSVPWCD